MAPVVMKIHHSSLIIHHYFIRGAAYGAGGVGGVPPLSPAPHAPYDNYIIIGEKND